MIKLKKRGFLIVISAPSGAGKGTIVNKLLQNNPNRYLSVSTTTREMRGNDIPGVTYNFVKEEEFKKKIEEGYFLEYTNYAGNFYGTPKKDIEEKLADGCDVILEIEVEGALNIKKMFEDAICIFILPPSFKELVMRLKKRGTDDKEKIRKRVNKAYEEIKEINNYDYAVINDEIDNVVLLIEDILKAEKWRVKRIEDITLDKKEDIEILINEDNEHETY